MAGHPLRQNPRAAGSLSFAVGNRREGEAHGVGGCRRDHAAGLPARNIAFKPLPIGSFRQSNLLRILRRCVVTSWNAFGWLRANCKSHLPADEG
jgi:hypothetical protein